MKQLPGDPRAILILTCKGYAGEKNLENRGDTLWTGILSGASQRGEYVDTLDQTRLLTLDNMDGILKRRVGLDTWPDQ